MPKKSAGILLYRLKGEPEFFLVHPGGPFWTKKDSGTWSIPKGEFDDNEDALDAAIREFKEETGFEVPGDFMTLNPVKQSNGKTIYAFAQESDLDASKITCNAFEMEWPPKSGKLQSFPEVDRGGWFNAEMCRVKLNAAQLNLVEEVLDKLEKRI